MKLLLPIEADRASMRAISFARTFLKGTDTATLLHVIRPLHSPQINRFIGRQRVQEIQLEDAKASLAEKEALFKLTQSAWSIQYEFGDPASVISSFAKEHDLVVMGTNGHGPVSGFLLGSVSNATLKRLTTPVILVPNAELPVDSDSVSRILIPVDGSDAAHRTTKTAIELAQKIGAACTLLHVISPPSAYGIDGFDREDHDELISIGEELLEAYEEHFQERQMPYTKKVLIGNPVEGILEEAERLHVGLIALGYQGVNVVAESVFGSVTFKMIHRTKTPLLIVK